MDSFMHFMTESKRMERKLRGQILIKVCDLGRGLTLRVGDIRCHIRELEWTCCWGQQRVANVANEGDKLSEGAAFDVQL